MPQEPDRLPDRPIANFDSELHRVRDKLQAELGRWPQAKFVCYTMAPHVGKKILVTSENQYPAPIYGIHGKLILTMAILPNGSVALVELDRTSGNVLLDQAAARFVQFAAPFEPFPSNLQDDIDLLVITRTFTFITGNDKSFSDDAPLWRPLNVQ